VLKVEYFDTSKNKYWDLCTEQEVKMFNDFTLFSPDGTLYAQIDKKKQLQVFQKNSAKELTTFTNVDKNQTNFSPLGAFLGVLSHDGILQLWNIKKRSISATINDVVSCDFLGCDTVIRIKFKDKKSKIFRFTTYQNPFNVKKDTIKRLSGGTKPIKFSDLNIICKYT
jgi:uncharacterized protein with WD repeat